jgi:probable rRNA maturation factor
MNDISSDTDVLVEDERWTSEIADLAALCASCRAAAAALEPRIAGDVALLFTDDAALRDLNLRFRRIDKPANVLSFPSGAPGGGPLGDIAIAFETCRTEADAQGIAFRDHVAHLIVHGLLHLAGHDHERDEDAERMESLETRILARLDIADPYGAAAAEGRA